MATSYQGGYFVISNGATEQQNALCNASYCGYLRTLTLSEIVSNSIAVSRGAISVGVSREDAKIRHRAWVLTNLKLRSRFF